MHDAVISSSTVCLHEDRKIQKSVEKRGDRILSHITKLGVFENNNWGLQKLKYQKVDR